MPREPNIPGIKDFQGKMMHSARWDWTYDLKGKKVAVIGNGRHIPSLVAFASQRSQLSSLVDIILISSIEQVQRQPKSFQKSRRK